MVGKQRPAIPRESKAECLYRLVGEPALFQIFLRGVGEPRRVENGCRFQKLEEPLTFVFLFFTSPLIDQLHPSPLGEDLECAFEIKSLHSLDKRKDAAADVAPEAMLRAPVLRHVKRRCALRMKGAPRAQ